MATQDVAVTINNDHRLQRRAGSTSERIQRIEDERHGEGWRCLICGAEFFGPVADRGYILHACLKKGGGAPSLAGADHPALQFPRAA